MQKQIVTGKISQQWGGGYSNEGLPALLKITGVCFPLNTQTDQVCYTFEVQHPETEGDFWGRSWRARAEALCSLYSFPPLATEKKRHRRTQ